MSQKKASVFMTEAFFLRISFFSIQLLCLPARQKFRWRKSAKIIILLFMLNYIWPLALIVLSNAFYQICAKSVPMQINAFASLTVTYIVGAVVSFGIFFLTKSDALFFEEFKKINWASVILGLSIVGLETGYIYAFKAGWPVSICQIVQASILAIILIFVGFFFYHEGFSWNKIAGIVVSLFGLALINLK